MGKSFVKPNDPILTKVAQEVVSSQINSPEIKKIIDKMLRIIREEQKKYRRGVGLAAPQIGISKRIILVDVKADGKGKVGNLRIYINPEIIWMSKRKGGWYEGCYSTGKVCGIVSRSTSIEIRGFKLQYRIGVSIPIPDRKFEKVEEKYSGYVARIFQHEIDHLNGREFVSHIKDPDKLHWVLKKEFPLYRNMGAWRNWPRKWKNPLLKKVLKRYN